MIYTRIGVVTQCVMSREHSGLFRCVTIPVTFYIRYYTGRKQSKHTCMDLHVDSGKAELKLNQFYNIHVLYTSLTIYIFTMLLIIPG